MKYFLIAGEASGDLHASHLMHELRQCDKQADFCFYGGDLMSREGGVRLKHYDEMAYMGIIPVLLHLPAILRNMRECKQSLLQWKPDVVILVDYPGFNLSMARFVHTHNLCPVYYYISPKIWAWKEGRIRQIKRYVDCLYSILPFEVDFFEKKHHFPITYVGNPTVDEVSQHIAEHGAPHPDGRTVALLPGSRRQEISDNLSRMLKAASDVHSFGLDRLVVACAPSIPRNFYERIVAESGIDSERVEYSPSGGTYNLLSHATVALVTSGTATLETALFGVPQVVCYYVGCGFLVRLLRRLFLKVKYVSLVNLICDAEIVPELIADEMNVATLQEHLHQLLPGTPQRECMIEGYGRMRRLLGSAGTAVRAARDMVLHLQASKNEPQ